MFTSANPQKTGLRMAAIMISFLLVGMGSASPAAYAQVSGKAGEPCDLVGARIGTNPVLECKSITAKGKTSQRWVKSVMPPAPRSVGGIRRCMWGRWLVTGQAFSDYWSTALEAFSEISRRVHESAGDPPRASTQTGTPVVWTGALLFEFHEGDVREFGQMDTEGAHLTAIARIGYTAQDSGQVTFIPEVGGGFWKVANDAGEGTPTEAGDETEIPPFTITIECNRRTMTYHIPSSTGVDVRLVMTRTR